MANTLKNLARTVVANAATAYVTAANPGSPNNQRITIKRIKILNNSGAAANASLWAGSAADNAHAIVLAVPLNAGESLEWDPTTIVLEPGESLWAQSSVAGALTLTADGLRQTE